MEETGLEELLETATGAPERLVHYNGEVVVWYNDTLHVYYTTDEDGVNTLVPGSTSVVGILDKSGPLTQWAANSTVLWVIENFPELAVREHLAHDYERIKNKLPWDEAERLASVEAICSSYDLAKLLNDARFNYRSITKTAADIGHIAHAWLEGYVKAVIAEAHYAALLPTDEKALNGVNAALAWFARHEFRPIHSEHKIHSRKHGYSGTYDWLAYVHSCGDPECCPFDGARLEIGDFKTSRALYDEYRIQLSSYVEAHEEEYKQIIDGVRLLHLDKNTGELESMSLGREELRPDFDCFLGLLQAYHWQKQIDFDRRYAKNEAKAEKNAAKDAEKLAKAQAKAEKKAAKLAADALKPKRKIKRAVIKQAAEAVSVAEIPIEVEGEVTVNVKAAPKLRYQPIPVEVETAPTAPRPQAIPIEERAA